jgi:hypothetical protein
LPPIDQEQVYIFFILINYSAIGDGIFLPQVYSVLSTFFSDTEPFDILANFKLFQTSSVAVGFLFKTILVFKYKHICVSVCGY